MHYMRGHGSTTQLERRGWTPTHLPKPRVLHVASEVRVRVHHQNAEAGRAPRAQPQSGAAAGDGASDLAWQHIAGRNSWRGKGLRGRNGERKHNCTGRRRSKRTPDKKRGVETSGPMFI